MKFSPTLHLRLRRRYFSLVFLVLVHSFFVLATSNTVNEVELADINHEYLVPSAANIEAGFKKSSSTVADSELSIVNVITTTDVASALSSLAAAFRTIDPSFSLVVTTVDGGVLVKDGFIHSGLYDLAVTPVAPSAADLEVAPNLEFFPYMALGIGVIYHLPHAVTNGFPLRMSGKTMCKIYRGNITHWHDPKLINSNPNFNFDLIPTNQLIEVITVSTPLIMQVTFANYCRKVDATFAQLIPDSSIPIFQAASMTSKTNLDTANDAVADTPYSITITSIPRARAVPFPLASIMTSSNTIELTGTSDSVELGLTELASKSSTDALDLTNPTNPQGHSHTQPKQPPSAWPVSTPEYIYLDSTNTRTTCATKRLLLQFLLWSFSNEIPRSLLAAADIRPLPSLIIERFGILERLRNNILCDNAALVAANAATLFVSADAASTDLIGIYSQFYTTIDDAYTFATRSLPESLSLERLRVNEAAFALVRPGLFDDADLDTVNAHGFISLPAFMTGVVPIFNLPKEIQSMAQNVTGQLLYQLPNLYPLVLDKHTLSRIFLGNVTSWLDGDLVGLNPQLSVWFNVSEANTTLTVIVGATALSDPSAAAKVMFKVMHSSDVAQESRYRKIFGSSTEVISNNAAWKNTLTQNPFELVLDESYIDSPPKNFVMLDYETRLSIKTSVTPGAISYRTIGSQGIGVSDEKVEFRMVQTNTAGEREVVTGTTSGMMNCASIHLSETESIQTSRGSSILSGTLGDHPLLDLDRQLHWVSGRIPPPRCWPLSTLISIVLPMQYTTNKSAGSTYSTTSSSATTHEDPCDFARHGIEYANYIQSTATLSLPAEQLGLVRLATASLLSDLSRSVFYAATCDDAPVLVTVPTYFRISPSISQFGYAIGGLGLATTIVSLVMVILYRHRVIIRSSSVPFLVFILCGIGLLYVSLIAWSYGPTPTTVSCSAFLWLSQLGLMMVYIPLFAKTYRVWRIFSGSHLKVIKIGNRKLMAMSAVAVAIDVIFLGIWQGVSPIQPIQYDRPLNDHWDYYTHCTVQQSGLPFVIIEAVYKAGILVFGALMAFSTRSVKATFNESTQIAWSIYNTLLAAIIVATMIGFLHAIQSSLIILVQILLLWIPLCTWGLLFIPKFQILFSQTENDVMETSRSELLPQEKSNGFSFASVAFMNSQQLRAYYDALKAQVIKVQQRLGLAISRFEAVKDVNGSLGVTSRSGHHSSTHSRNNSKVPITHTNTSLISDAATAKSLPGATNATSVIESNVINAGGPIFARLPSTPPLIQRRGTLTPPKTNPLDDTISTLPAHRTGLIRHDSPRIRSNMMGHQRPVYTTIQLPRRNSCLQRPPSIERKRSGDSTTTAGTTPTTTTSDPIIPENANSPLAIHIPNSSPLPSPSASTSSVTATQPPTTSEQAADADADANADLAGPSASPSQSP